MKYRIGPAGNSKRFYDSGFKHTFEAPAWLHGEGLNAFEYSFGRGVNLGAAAAERIADEMRKYDISISCHAPYYINLANEDGEMAEKSFGYILSSLRALKNLGGKRCVFHAAGAGKDRRRSFWLTKERLARLLALIDNPEFEGLYLCPETMGKVNQIGTVEEILELCAMSDRLIPCFDFGHINSLTQGALKGEDDFRRIVERSFDVIGERTRVMHVHFSKIQYGKSGEIRHLEFDDTVYGPEFEPFAKVIVKCGLNPVLICESAENMADDAIKMRDILQKTV